MHHKHDAMPHYSTLWLYPKACDTPRAPRKLLASVWAPAALIASAILVLGCGKSNGVAPVHGSVTLDGNPLTEGYVFVTPAKGRMAKGKIQTDGTFVLGTYTDADGAKIGSHPVTVLPPAAQEGAPLSATAKALPQHYSNATTSGISVDVKPGVRNELSVQLTSEIDGAE